MTSSAASQGRNHGPISVLVNRKVDWNAFDPKAYHAHNYRTLRDDDRQILAHVRDFFGAAKLPPNAIGLDIGPGANLYPALSMLPLCTELDLIEYSAANVAWLRRQQSWHRRFDNSWTPFWNAYGEHDRYRRYVDTHHPLEVFRRKAQVRQGSIYNLPRAHWDIGTMFFVACSLSSSSAEFCTAVARFLNALKPGAPFAAAFMTGSIGYEIKDQTFRAFPVTQALITQSLQRKADNVETHDITTDLRPGVRMALATGFRRP